MMEKQKFSSAEEEGGSIWPQCLTAFIVSLAYMTVGCVLGWTSPTLPLLKENHYIKLTAMEESWISGLVPMGAFLSPLPAGYLMESLGYKILIFSLAGLYVLGWAAVAAARSASILYSARFVMGIAVGITLTVCPSYVGEIAQVKVRGALGCLVQVFTTAGFLYVYVLGPWTSYVVLAIASGAVPALLLVGLFFIPDSPYQLLKRGKKDEARRAFLWLRGKTDSMDDKELQDIEREVAELQKQQTSIKDLVANRATIKALLLAQGMVGSQQLSGVNAVLFFAQNIFSQSVSTINPSIATIIVGAVMFGASLVTPLVVDRSGRRILLLVSAAGMSLSLTVLGAFFYLTNTGAYVSSYGFVPTLSLVIYITVYSMGFGSLAWPVSAELFAPLVRSKAASLTASTCWVLCFVVTFFFQSLVSALGSHVVFWMFAVCCAASGAFVFVLLPETKGKTLQEIQQLLGA